VITLTFLWNSTFTVFHYRRIKAHEVAMSNPFIPNEVTSRPLNCFCEIGLLIATVRDANDGYLLSRILLLVLRDAGRAVIRLCARARVACASIRSLFVPFYTCVYTTYILTDLRCPRETAALHVVCNEVHIRYARASRRRLQWALSGRITMNDAFSVQHVTTCQ